MRRNFLFDLRSSMSAMDIRSIFYTMPQHVLLIHSRVKFPGEVPAGSSRGKFPREVPAGSPAGSSRGISPGKSSGMGPWGPASSWELRPARDGPGRAGPGRAGPGPVGLSRAGPGREGWGPVGGPWGLRVRVVACGGPCGRVEARGGP